VPYDVVVLPVEGLDRAASPAALEAALLRAGVESVSMNVAAGRVRIAFDSARLTLRDLAAIVCAGGCGLYVLKSVMRTRGLDDPWRCAAVVELLCRVAGVVDAEWDREMEVIVVSYLPSRSRSSDLTDTVALAGYRRAVEAVIISEVPAMYFASPDRRVVRARAGTAASAG
jgi:hypothetical protein